MARFARAAVFTVLMLGSGACHPTTGLIGGNGKLVVGSGSVDFGPTFLGASPQRSLRLSNSGTVEIRLSLALSGDPQFQVGTNYTAIPGGGFFDLPISLHAAHLGAAAATLQVAGDDTAKVPITAQVVPDLPCPNDNPCIIAKFDPDQGTCSMTPVPDGHGCDDGDPCTTSKVCSGGICKGELVNCDDHSICTTDYCEKGVGCQNLDHSTDCMGSNPCKIYFCDSQSGCQSVDATDGTPCSASVPCILANVCLAGQCTGLPIPDGTPCRSPINPCANDATCMAGKCESPTADLLQPGDVLWKDVALAYRDSDGGLVYENPDAGGFGWRGVASIDDVGNLYLDDDSDSAFQELVSMDVCGKERWRVPFTSPNEPLNGRHLIFGTLVFSTSKDGSIVGQSNINGAILWKYDPGATLGADGGALPAGTLHIEDVALSNQGIFYYTGTWLSKDASGATQISRVIGGLLRNGQSRFQKVLDPLPPSQNSFFGYPLLVDENENLYTSGWNVPLQDIEIESFDETGNARWTLPVNAPQAGLLKSFSENNGLFVEANPLMAFDSRGTLVWSQGFSPFGTNAAHSPVVATDGTTSVFEGTGGGTSSLIAFKGDDGTSRWSFDIPNAGQPATSHVLDAAGRVYFLGGDAANDGIENYTINSILYGLDDTDGRLLLNVPLDPQLKISVGVLGLTPAGSLIVSARQQLTGIFTGAPMAASPWPRFRGDNRNRSCPQPANTPILPP
jgi:outer membrane protein assembly factor BamB